MSEKIVQEGEPVLRKKARHIEPKEIGSAKLRKLIEYMKQVLGKEENGVGLAAPQVGEALRLFIVSGKAFLPDQRGNAATEAEEKQTTPPDMVFINPELLRTSRGTKEMAEGCLSVRGVYGAVKRHEKATVKALDEAGKSFTYHASGLVAHIFQHEMDHLDGILYIDKATKLEKDDDKHEARTRLRKKYPPGERARRS